MVRFKKLGQILLIMKLLNLKILAFKCFENSGIIPIHDLTVFIGENDSGKSTILDALEIILNNKMPGIEDFREDQSNVCIEVIFNTNDIENEYLFLVYNKQIRVKKIITNKMIASLFFYTAKYEDEDLYRFNTMNAADLKALMKKYKLEEEVNQEKRKMSIKKFLDSGNSLPKTEDWKQIKQNEISNFLPIFQRFSSHEYGNPENVIRRTLELVYRSSFYDKGEDGRESLKSDFSDLKSSITQDLNDKLEKQLLSQLKKYKPELTAIKGSYDIDFARGLSFSGLNIIDQSGKERSLTQIGEGSKKKIFLSILEWDAEINSKQNSNKLIIRAYDEPDSNLHYEAQRKMFYVIRDLAIDETTNIQSLICTHSITMIDRAPSKCINHVIREPIEEVSEIQFLTSESDSNVKEFLDQVSEVSGFKNSSIFYEKCFLIVEGESEQNALPIMYRKVTGRFLSEDGIVLINLQTNGQWNNALRFLNSNKENCTVILLDSDTQYSSSTNIVTKEKLEDIGFNSKFLSENCFFIGIKEFEDVFTDEQLVNIFNDRFKKHDKTNWAESEILALRIKPKFSNALTIKLNQECKQRIGKPQLAEEIAHCLTPEEIKNIQVLELLFNKIKSIIE